MRRPVVLLALPVLLLTGCSGTAAAQSTPTPTAATVHGTMTLGVSAFLDNTTWDTDNTAAVAGDPCTAYDGYKDIASGAEVDVVDGSGKVLALGSLSDGTVTADTSGCAFPFTVDKVPNGESIYGVKVGNQARGIVHFTKAQMFGLGPELTLG